SGDFRPRRTEERSGDVRPRRTEERSGDFRPRRTEERSGDFRPRRTEERTGDFRPRRTEERSGDFRKSDNRTRPADGKKRSAAPRRDDKPKAYPKYNPNKQTGEVRLNRFISQSGVCSRREADEFILAGVVTVNGQVVTELGTKILPTDEVRFNDERLQGEKNVYLVLNKPKGYVTSLDDPHADKTVMDLVRGACSERVYPVGRLDKNSLGLLLITNDGDITRQLTHPSYHKKKIYQVTLDKPLTRADMDSLTEGITLEDGDIFADEVAYASEDKRTVGVEIHSGRNRIVRRMFEHLGYAVQKLDRVYYAGLTKKNLKRGAWRFLTKDEVMRLKTGQYE
ncbi:MAG: pseudouridine synthase, partial [Alistipes sp.]|nr:pseudouridine synthase [Alistipes sp.]